MRLPSPTTLRRAAELVLPCLATVLAAATLTWWFRAPLFKEATRGSAVERAVVPALARWAVPAPPGRVRGVFFGDSLTMSLEAVARGRGRGQGQSQAQAAGLPLLVEQLLKASRAPVSLLGLTHAAFRPVQLAYVLDEVIAGRPRFAVVGINLRLLSPAWQPGPGLRFLPLSRKLSLSRQAALWPSLREEGLGLLDPQLYRAQDALSLLYVMDGVRLLGKEWIDARAHDLERTLGLRRRMLRAYPLEDDVKLYAPDPARHAMAEVMREVNDELAAAGVWTLFYVSPVNPHALDPAGSPSWEELAARIEELRVAIGASPAHWLDLHAALPASQFRDLHNHLEPSGLRTVAEQIASRLRPIVLGPGAAAESDAAGWLESHAESAGATSSQKGESTR